MLMEAAASTRSRGGGARVEHAAVVERLLQRAETAGGLPNARQPLLEAVYGHAMQRPHDVALVWLDDGGTEVAQLTFAQVWVRSVAVACHLLSPQVGLRRGDAVLVVFPFGIDFLPALLACLRTGIVAVSVYPPNPSKLSVDLPRLAAFAEDSHATVALTTLAFTRAMAASKLAGHQWPTAIRQWIPTDDVGGLSPLPVPKTVTLHMKVIRPENGLRRVLSGTTAAHTVTPQVVGIDAVFDPDAVAFIQYTSGSTGSPKGVVVTHRALSYNVALMMKVAKMRSAPDAAAVCWVPQYHDMGLIGCYLAGLALGAIVYGMSPITFVKQPKLWIDILHRYKATHTTAPPFGWALAAKRVQAAGGCAPLDFLVEAGMGGEPISKASVEAMWNVLGIRPAAINAHYGCAEMVLSMTGGSPPFHPHTMLQSGNAPIAACGSVSDAAAVGSMVVIVHPDTHVELGDGEHGLIWVQSPSMAAGYYHKPDDTAARFQCTVASPGRLGYWYNTLDMGYVSEGQLYVLGRATDLIIINGRKVYPTDVEATTNTTLGEVIRPGSTVAVQLSATEVAVLVEARASPAQLPAEALHNTVSVLEQSFPLSVRYMGVYLKGQLPKTTSGKVRRKETRKLLLSGTLPAVLSVGELDDTTIHPAGSGGDDGNAWLQFLHSHGVLNVNTTLAANGLDSLRLIRFLDAARSRFQVDIPPTLADSVSCAELLDHCTTTTKVAAPPVPAFLKITSTPTDRVSPAQRVWRQCVVVLVLMALVTACAMPAGYVFTAQDLRPHLASDDGGPGPLLVLLPLTWMGTLTVLMIISKWLLIGRYAEGFIGMWTYRYCAWWLVDRLHEIWAAYVGIYLLDTPYLTLVYKLMGAHISWQCRLKTFVREPDLFEAGPSTTIAGQLLTRILTKHGVQFARQYVRAHSHIPSHVSAYPGESLDSIEERAPAYQYDGLYLQRGIAPCIGIGCAVASTMAASWITGQMGMQPGFWRVAVCIPGSGLALTVYAAVFCRLLKLDFIVNYVASLAESVTGPWTAYSVFLVWLYRLYGASLGPGVSLNASATLAPADAHKVTIGSGTVLSRCMLQPSSGSIRIGSNVSIGYMSVVGTGCKLGDGCSTFPRSIVPPNTTVASHALFMDRTGTAISATQHAESAGMSWCHLAAYEPIAAVLHVVFLWCPIAGGFALVNAASSSWLADTVADWATWSRVWFATWYVACCAAGAVLLLLLVMHWCCIRPLRSTARVPAFSIRAAMYIAVLGMGKLFALRVQPFITGTCIHALILRLCGCSIASLMDVHIYEGFVHDPRCTLIGSGVVIDRGTSICGHSMSAGVLTLDRTVLGNDCSLHPGCFVRAGEIIANGTMMCAGSVMFGPTSSNHPDAPVAVFRGAPAQRCRGDDNGV